MNLRIILIAFFLCLLVGCSTTKENVPSPENKDSPEVLYQKGVDALKKRDLHDAASYFGQVAYEFPYHKWSNKAEVMEIYANYLMAEYDTVIESAEQYVKLHPASSDVPYILYLKALSYYEQIDIPFRDQEATVHAKQALIDVIKRFPKSTYAKDSRMKLDLVNDHLAANEMIIGRYYLKNGSILSAINRFKTVVDEYSATTHVQEALYRLVEAYMFLDVPKEAQRNAAVLGYNYPNSSWYAASYNLIKTKTSR